MQSCIAIFPKRNSVNLGALGKASGFWVGAGDCSLFVVSCRDVAGSAGFRDRPGNAGRNQVRGRICGNSQVLETEDGFPGSLGLFGWAGKPILRAIRGQRKKGRVSIGLWEESSLVPVATKHSRVNSVGRSFRRAGRRFGGLENPARAGTRAWEVRGDWRATA
jgi:hypothetical protein